MLNNNENEINSLLEVYYKLDNQQWYFTNCVCQLLNHKQDFEKSLSILNAYEKSKTDFPTEFYLFKILLNIILNNIENVKATFIDYINSFALLDDGNIFNLLHTIHHLHSEGIASEFINSQLEQIVLTKPFSYVELQTHFKCSVRIILNIDLVPEVEAEIIKGIQDCEKFSEYQKNLIVQNLNRIGYRKNAIDYLETYVDKSKISESLRLYIHLLKEQLLDKNDEERGRYKELLHLLQFWRENCDSLEEDFLRLEHNLYAEINDEAKLVEIDKFLFESNPSSEELLSIYLSTLERAKQHETIKSLSKIIPTKFTNERKGVLVSGILIRTGTNTEKGFVILYNLASDKSNTYARKIYLGNSNLFPDKFINYEKVEIGTWVSYIINGERQKINITKSDGIQKEFIGKSVNETFIIGSSLSNTINNIQIVEVMNEYKHLFQEIFEEGKNPINELGIESMEIPSNIEEFEALLIKRHGIEGNERKLHSDNILKSYFNSRIGFLEVVWSIFNDNYLDAYTFLTSNIGNKFITIPNLVTAEISTHKEELYVLDSSTFLLFIALEKEFDLKYTHKYIISSLIRIGIEEEISELKHSHEAKMSIQITTEGVRKIIYPENFNQIRIEYLESVKLWIFNNCIEDLVEEKLDVLPKLTKNEPHIKGRTIKLMTDYLYLSQREGYRLISSDTTIFTFSIEGNFYRNTLNPEKYFLSFFPQNCNTEFYRFLLKSNYLGISINLETLKNEFQDFLAGKENYYTNALDNLQFSIHGNSSIINIAVKFMREMYLMGSIKLESKNIYSFEVIRNLFYGMPKELHHSFYTQLHQEFKLLGDYYNHVINQFNIARKIFTT